MSLIGQSWELMCELAKRTPWGRIQIQPLINDIANVAPEFVRFLENGGRVIVQQRTFPLWRTVMLGRHQTPETYLASIEARGRKPNKWARDIAAKTTCSQEVIDLPLVDVSGADLLGFTQVYTYAQFLERAATFGLYRCPAETGLVLADQFDGQPYGDYRRIAMEAIADFDGGLSVFCVYHDGGGLRLGTDSGRPGSQSVPESRWVLTTRKP